MIPQVYYVIAIAGVLVGASWHISSSMATLAAQMVSLQGEVAKSTGNAIHFAKELGGLEARVTLLERNRQ